MSQPRWKGTVKTDRLPRTLAAIVYADVAEYSRLTGEDEEGTHRQLSASLDLIADRIRNSGGEVVHYAGHAVLARFQSVVAATNCAIGIQNAISALCAELDEDKRLLFRIGINLGEGVRDSGGKRGWGSIRPRRCGTDVWRTTSRHDSADRCTRGSDHLGGKLRPRLR